MTQVIALAPRHAETAPILSRMDFNKAAGEQAGANVAMELRRPSSPRRTASTRKRAASINTAEANHPGHAAGHPVLDQLRVNTSSPMKQEASRDMICLCTPAPKIPRPRNAFILYRQHHQARVTADNPKLSNPEISKIIGEKWKNEQDEVKGTWKKLAEEEKQRHQHQYPNYRYQPRRGARAQASWPGTSPTEEQGRCPKCNGRFIATPRTPATPFPTAQPAKAAFGPQSAAGLRRLETRISPRPSMEHSPSNKPLFSNQLPPVQSADECDPMSPEMKRRRANDAGAYHVVGGMQGEYGRRPGDFGPMGSEAGTPNSIRPYAPLPEMGGLPRSQSGPMPPPPPRPTVPGAWSGHSHDTRRHSGFDESLRLPPLQPSISPSPVRTRGVEARQASSPAIELGPGVGAAQEPHARSLEDAVMSLSFKRKLAILSRICRPIPPLGFDRLSAETRGALIAVEGPNARLLQEAGQVIENGLLACDEVALKVWSSESDRPVATRGENSAMQLSERGAIAPGGDFFPLYFQTLLSWQEKSNQIANHITSEPTVRAYPGAENEETRSRRPSLESGKSPEEYHSPISSGKVPVALIKEGFSLTTSDRFACTTPIRDAYTPVDHWQWMASLWRGTICPDLVVYVKPSVDEEINQFGNVEFAKSMGLIVVRVPVGNNLDEATARRIAFEVMEWMRDGSFRDEVPKNWRLD